MSFAAVLAAMPDLLARALAEHVPDPEGRCRECREEGTAAAWPCAMRLLAEEASGMTPAAPAQAVPPPVETAALPVPEHPADEPVVDPFVDTEEWDPIAYRRAFRREGGWR
jgi:hypothetical protein